MENLLDFNDEIWESIINSGDFLSIEEMETNSNFNENTLEQKRIVKLTKDNYQIESFVKTQKYICMARSMHIIYPPSNNQRIRYENECKNTIRYMSISDNRNLTIKIPDLSDLLQSTETLWMRITRTTIPNGSEHVQFHHPYPLWIRNRTARIHSGSIYVEISETDIKNGLFEINTLAMLRLKQEQLAKLNDLAVYKPDQLDFSDFRSIESKNPKRIRDEYQLQQSIINFQLVRVDQNNIAYPTDCRCQTDILHELEPTKGQNQRRTTSRKRIKF